MEVTITEVSFIAYDRACREYFADESWEKIHATLYKMCSTYEVIAINQVTALPKYQPLSVLTKFKTETPK